LKISIVGTGYMGMVFGTCFVEVGNTVFCAVTDARKIESLMQERIPIHESGLESLVQSNARAGGCASPPR